MQRLIAVFIIAILLLVISLGVLGATITVPDDYPTIQEAIDAAQPDDTVYVKAGRYTENIVIDKPLSLVGEDRATMIIESPDTEKDVVTVMLASGEALIKGITVTGGRNGAAIVMGVGEVTLQEITAINNDTGVTIAAGGKAVIIDTYIISNKSSGIILANSEVYVHSNEILRNGAGIVLVSGNTAELADNLVGSCSWGILTYTVGCGWAAAPTSFSEKITGKGNKVQSLNTDICPSYPGEPWPDGFVDTSWSRQIAKVIDDYTRGKDLYEKQNYQEALAAYKAGLVILQKSSFPLAQADINQGIGSAYSKLGRYKEALDSYSQALSIFYNRSMEADFNDVISLCKTISAMPSCLGSYQKSLGILAQVHSLFMRYNLELLAADTEVSIGLVHAKYGSYNAALEAFTSAQKTYEEHNLPDAVAMVNQNMGVTYAFQGSYETALSYLQATETYLEAQKAAFMFQVFSGRSISIAHYKLGQNPRISPVESLGSEADVWLNMGAVYAELGRYDAALDKLKEARTIYKDQYESETDQADVDFNVASIQSELGQYQEALDSLKKARAVYERKNLLEDQADIDLNAAGIYIELGQYSEALARLDNAQAIYEGQDLSIPIAYVCTDRGFISLGEGDMEGARGYFTRALSTFTSASMKPYTTFLNMAIGDTYHTAIPPKALEYYNIALKDLQGADIPEIKWRALYKSALCYESLGHLREAKDFYEESVKTIESVRSHLTSEALKMFWQQKSFDVYERLIKLLIEHGQGSAAFPYAERCRARTFLDLLAKGPVGTIENVAEEGIKTGVVKVSAIKADVDEVISSLPPDTTALEYFVTDTATYVWVLRDGKVNGPIQLDHGRAELMHKVIEARKQLEEQSPVVNRDLAILYDWLIRPVEDLLPEATAEGAIPHLIIIPSGPLYYLPFQALLWTSQDRSEDAPVIQRYALSYAPSLATLKYAQGLSETAYLQATFLGLADPDSGDPSIRRLPDAQTEARTVAKLFPVSSVYVDKGATEDVIQSHSSTQREILLSTHGSFNPHNPMFSYLIVSPTEENTDGKLHAYEVFSLPLHADMVVLSACETLLPSLEDMKNQLNKIARRAGDNETKELTDDQLKKLTTGDEVVGLTRAFIYAGASSVLSSLWSVPSGSTTQLMVSFYEHMAEGMDKAQALRAAELKVMDTTGYTPPLYWAAFNLVGDWR